MISTAQIEIGSGRGYWNLRCAASRKASFLLVHFTFRVLVKSSFSRNFLIGRENFNHRDPRRDGWHDGWHHQVRGPEFGLAGAPIVPEVAEANII